MACILCEKQKPLCNSHVIPEFAYQRLYDEKHRAIVFAPLTPENFRYLQKGLRDRLLCNDCEGYLNDTFEKPFCENWIDGNALSALDGTRADTLTGIDYSAFKLFHLSVLFRAHHATIPNFAEVNVSAHASSIRQMLLSKNAGKQWEYFIVASALENPDGTI